MTVKRKSPLVDAVVIGRNEGARLQACLTSLAGTVRHIVYVDSASTDGSPDIARNLGARVIDLDLSIPFTAARARNAGWTSLANDPPDYVQFVDGDCVVEDGWIAAALNAFSDYPMAVAICGRRAEKFTEASVYNRMADREWNTPVGRARACGGDVLMRYQALAQVDGYRGDLIAGEEPELCVRLRRAGGEIWRIDAPMTRHDAAMYRFSQWWKRARRAGYAFAEGAALHGAPPERHWVAETRRAFLWGAFLPAGILLLGAIWPPLFFLALIYPAQFARLAYREGPAWAFFTVVGKFAEAQGVLEYWLGRWTGRKRGILEYK